MLVILSFFLEVVQWGETARALHAKNLRSNAKQHHIIITSLGVQKDKKIHTPRTDHDLDHTDHTDHIQIIQIMQILYLPL